MARLQKTLGTVESVASVGRAAPEVDFLSQAAPQVAALAGNITEAVGERKADTLEEEFGSLASDVAAIRVNKDLEEVTDRMKRLAKGAEQGRLSDTAIKLETEALLKSAIEKNPLFASKLRRRAAEVLGFDPTGTEMQALLGFGQRQQSRPLTPGEKRRAKAEDFARLGLGDADNLEKLLAKAELGEVQTQFASDQAKLGEIGSDEVLNASLNNVDSYISDATGTLLQAVAEGGFTAVDSTTRVLELNRSLEASWSRHRKALTDGGINLSASKLGEQRRLFDLKFEPIREMFADDATMEVILTKQNRALIAQASINGYDMFPGLAAVNSALGQVGVTSFFNIMSKTSSPAQIELIKRTSPAFAAIADNKADATKAMRNSFNRIMGVPTDSPDVIIPGLDDVIRHGMVKDNKEPEVRNRVLESLKAKGQAFKSMSHYGQRGVRALSTPEEVNYIVERWGVEFDPIVSRVAATVKNVEGLNLSVTNGVLKIESTGAVASNAPPSMAILGNFAQIPSELVTDVKRLNAMNGLVQNGWGDDVGQNPTGFLERTINQVETLRADQEVSDGPDELGAAFEAVLRSPTIKNLDALESLDPELLRAARALVLSQGGGEGGK